MALRLMRLAAALLACCEVGALEAAVRGVAPEKQSAYGASSIKCTNLKGSEVELPASVVNDDFCDCADGSDEPGTGACAGQDSTLFHCPNEGGTPQFVYSSRVDDGVCDCCDGSDEAGLQARRPNLAKCANRCAEEGAKQRIERDTKIAALRIGMEKKEAAIGKAKEDRAKWQADLAAMQAKTPALEAALKTARDEKKAKDDAEKEEKRKQKLAEEASGAAASSAAATPAAVQGGGDDDLKKEVEALKAQLKQQQNEIIALQTEVDELKAGKGKQQQVPAKQETSQEEEKKQVSEYAKWMEDAGSTPGAIEGHEVPEELLDEDQDDEEEDAAAGYKASSKVESKGAEDIVQAKSNELEDHRDTIRTLKKKMETLSDDRLAYSSLADECIELKDGQYVWKVCFFDDAKQDSVRLGSWTKWTGPKSGEFDNGDMCPGGPARKLITDFECGAENKVLDVIEPSRCVYQARVSSPAACDAEEAERLENPPVKHPKDEL